MDTAIRQEAAPCRLVANATQLYAAAPSTRSLGRKRWGFFDRSHALSKGINALRAAAFSLGAVLASTHGTSSRAADLIGQVLLQAPPSVAIPFDWTGAYFGGHVGYSRGYGRNTLFDPDPTAAGTSFGSLFGGLQFGYNYVLPSRLLLGIEGDISFPNYLDDGIVASRSTPFSSVTDPRPGWLHPRPLAFLRHRWIRLVASTVPRGLQLDFADAHRLGSGRGR